MTPDVTKRVAVTFADGMPNGTHAHFKHDGKMWVAYPADKHTKILTLVDRLIGIHDQIHREMILWINEKPEDAKLVARVVGMTMRARSMRHDLVIEKVEVETS